MAQIHTPDAVIVLTTVPLEFEIDHLAEQLLHERLAACVSVLAPMRSVYRWQGQVERADERQVLIKTSRDRLPALEQAIRAAHPYEVPEFLALPVQAGSTDYLAWVMGETNSGD